MWLLRVVEFAAALVIAGLFLWYLWKVITNPKKDGSNAAAPSNEKSNADNQPPTHEQQ